MKRILVILLVTASLVVAQNGFEPVIADQPVNFSQVNDSYAWVRGHWAAVNPTDKKGALTGPSTSEISCGGKTCTDTNANVVVMGNTFALNAGYDEYTVERWNSKEIVASNVSGICRVRNVIKFDRVQKRVFWMQTLSEPLDTKMPQMSKDMCNAVGMNLELKDSTLWKK